MTFHVPFPVRKAFTPKEVDTRLCQARTWCHGRGPGETTLDSDSTAGCGDQTAQPRSAVMRRVSARAVPLFGRVESGEDHRLFSPQVIQRDVLGFDSPI